MPDVDAATVARRVLGWGKVHGDEWRMRMEREQAEKARATREAEEEERAREAREVAAARDEERSVRGEEVEVWGGPREGGDDEEGSAGSATAEKACGSEGAKTTGAASQDTAAGRPDPGTSVEKGADRSKEVREVEGVLLGPTWDARDLSRRLGLGEVQVSKSCFPFLNVNS
jgi:hypothetical protein